MTAKIILPYIILLYLASQFGR